MLNEAIRITVGVAPYDAACKRVLMEREIASRLVKACVPEYEGVPLDEVAQRCILGDPGTKKGAGAPPLLRGLRNDDNSVLDGDATFDMVIAAKAPGPDGRDMLLDIEPQGEVGRLPYPLPRRSLFYCARLVTSQHGVTFTNDDYQDLRKVYSIWVCLRPPKGTENTITRYEMTKKDVVGFVEDDSAEYDLMTVVMVRLGKPGSAGYTGILGLLGTLFSNNVPNDEKLRVLAEEYGIVPGERFKKEVAHVGSFGEVLFSEGVEKGEAKATLANIRSLMANLGLSLDRAMDALAIPAEDRERYAAEIASEETTPA